MNDGINIVAGFLPDGSAATIVRAWRGNGNAHGFHVLLVLAPQAEGHGAGVVTLMNPDSGGLEATISDNPFDGERVLSSVRFAFGEVRGKPASLMLRATLDNGRDGSLADHATALVRIFRVETTDGAPGDSPLEFRMLWSKRTTKLYCNSQLAMRDVLSVPLPANFAGPNRVDGCFDR